MSSWLFNLTVGFSHICARHKWIWWFLTYTWGLVGTIIGYLIELVMAIASVEHRKIAMIRFWRLKGTWGGFSMGRTFLIARDMGSKYEEQLRKHELGHTFQNALFGPFYFFLVVIPSVVRYWYRAGRSNVKPYDAIWFEGSATMAGEDYLSMQ